MTTIIILKLIMNNEPSSGVPLSKPDFEDSRSSWIVVPSKVHSIDQPQGYQGKCRLRFWKKNVKRSQEFTWYCLFEIEVKILRVCALSIFGILVRAFNQYNDDDLGI